MIQKALYRHNVRFGELLSNFYCKLFEHGERISIYSIITNVFFAKLPKRFLIHSEKLHGKNFPPKTGQKVRKTDNVHYTVII